ncbi:MAG: RAMP superfamily CRISPR-associated protein [Candidatus Lokiarchaeia archaeon]
MKKVLKLYRIRLKLESPLLVGYTPPDHNLYKTLSHIPSITLRGGIATQLLEEFCQNDTNFGKCEICNKQDDCHFYEFFYKNIFSISNGLYLTQEKKNFEFCCDNPDLVPTHPLIKQCKRCESDEKYINYLEEWQDENILYIRANCQNPDCNRKTTMDVLKNKNYCKNKDCRKILGTPETNFTISTAINYAKNSSLTGYLFTYSYILRDSIFDSYMLIEENKKIYEFLSELPFIRLGRSKSRGFGKVLIELEEIDLNRKIEDNKGIINRMIKNNSLILAAKTNIVDFNMEEESLDIITNPLINLNLALEYVKNKLNLNYEEFEDLFLLDETMGELETIGGWSFKTQQEKPHITVAKPGSLYKFKINPEKKEYINEEIIKAISFLEYIGLNNYSKLGYNLIYFPTMEELN